MNAWCDQIREFLGVKAHIKDSRSEMRGTKKPTNNNPSNRAQSGQHYSESDESDLESEPVFEPPTKNLAEVLKIQKKVVIL